MDGSNVAKDTASQAPQVAALTLADVLACVQASEALPPGKRAEIASSLRTIGRMVDRPLERIPADPTLLRQRLKQLTAANGGISRGRFSNVKSHLTAALRISGITTTRLSAPMTAKWQALFDAAPKSVHWRLSRLAHFCSARGIEPDHVDEAVVVAMRDEAFAEGLVKEPDTIWRSTIREWNEAAKKVPGWPQQFLTRPLPKKARWTIPIEKFRPELQDELATWKARLLNRNPLRADGPRRALRPTTVKYRFFYLLMIASALVHKGHKIEDITSLRYIVEPAHFFQAIEYMLDRYGGPTEALHNVAMAGKAVATHFVKLPESELNELRGLCQRLNLDIDGIRERNRERLLALDDDDNLAALLHLPATLLDEAMRLDNRDPLRAARLVQMALAIELLFHTALRIGNLAAIDLDRHVRRMRTRGSEVLHFVISRDDVKNRKDLHHELRGVQLALFDLYVERFRPRLAQPGNPKLFPGRFGGARNATGLSVQIKETVKEFTGLDVNAHLFRHIDNKIHQRVAPGDHVTMAHVLNDELATIMGTYALFERPGSLQHYQRSIAQLRAELPVRGKVRRAPKRPKKGGRA